MQKTIPNLWFRLMALEYRMKASPMDVAARLRAAGVRPGMTVLDYGCGPGRYAIPAARLVGGQGTVHAVDVHPLALRTTGKLARAAGLSNLRYTLTDGPMGVPSKSVDIALLYDALHDVEDKPTALAEICRVLKPGGTLSYRDHTLTGAELAELMRGAGFQAGEETSPGVTAWRIAIYRRAQPEPVEPAQARQTW